MRGYHVHYSGDPSQEWPVAICASQGAAHMLAMWLSTANHHPGPGLPEELESLRLQLDAKLVKDPHSTNHLKKIGDTSKEHVNHGL